MKLLKRLIILIGCCIISIFFILFLIHKNTNKIVEEEFENVFIESNQNILNEKIDATGFFTVELCVKQYINYVSTKDLQENFEIPKKEISMTEEERKQRIYTILHKRYIEDNGITIENVRNYVHNVNENLIFEATKISKFKKDEWVSNYGVYGILKRVNDEGKEVIGNMYIVVTLDEKNMTFAVTPIRDKINNFEELNLDIGLEQISENENRYNKFSYYRVKTEELIKKYMNSYCRNSLETPEIAYEYLDEEYREKRFGSLDNFKQYVNENREMIDSITLDKYQKTIKDGYTQYVCIDTNGNYYIFRETAVMQYTLLLDTYTIDIPEFTEKYNKADNETKVGMNIEKIKTALNNKDYNYIYTKLPDSFKNNYFPTVDILKQYMQTNLFEKNKIEYDSVDNEGINYMFDIKIHNEKDTTVNPVEKRIIMQLKEGTDFVFSFNVD